MEAVRRTGGQACGCLAVTSWNASDGLPGRYISAIAQDRQGFLWLGTDTC